LRNSSLRTYRVFAFGLLTLALGAVGCGNSASETAEVTGKVTFNGQPVTAGSVYFVLESKADGASGGAPIAADGTFKGRAPVGKCKVAIQTQAFKPREKMSGPPGTPPGGKAGPPGWAKSGGGAPKANTPPPDIIFKTGNGSGEGGGKAGAYVAIPDQYENADSSGLTFEIKKGIVNELGTIELTGTIKK
jgi:hypothetical protein